MKLDHCLTPDTKMSSAWIKEQHVRSETKEHLEEKISGKFLDSGLGAEFLGLTPRAEATRAKINKWGYIKFKKLHNKRNRQQHEKITY